METSATLSSCDMYRYALRRRWSSGPAILFLMLNPSTADAHQDDPTITRCISFAQRWGYGSLAVGNLFAFRATFPLTLMRCSEPIGPENDHWLTALASEADTLVAAWGNHGRLLGRSLEVSAMLPSLMCLGLTRRGEPRHPLYLPRSTELVPMATVSTSLSITRSRDDRAGEPGSSA